MDKAYKYAKSAIVHFKLETCCCFVPIRIGLLIVGYFNLFIALLSLIGTADGGITPPLMEVQDSLLEEDQVSTSAGVIAYSIELGFSAVLLCAMYRSDTVLLRVYIYFLMATVVTSLLMYSMVIAKVSTLTKITIVSNIVYNCYVIILVRSAIVDIKERQSSEKNGHVVLYSVSTVPQDEDKKAIDILPAGETSEVDNEPTVVVISEEINNDDKKDDREETKTEIKTDDTYAKLETVKENTKEEQSVLVH